MPSEDAGERFDPAAEIWADQKKKEQKAAAKRHEEKNDQLDQFRKQVKLQDTKRAQDTWGEAEAALKQVLAGKRKAAGIEAGVPTNHDDGLRKHGEHVKHRRDRDLKIQTEQAPQSSLPLQRTLGMSSYKAMMGDATHGLDDWGEAEASSGYSGSPSRSCSSPARTTGRAECFNSRSQLLLKKSRGPTEMLVDHEKKRLRAKIATVLIEVRKRQELHQVQEKQKKFRERRFAAGRGPAPSLGDSDEYALGLTCLSDTGGEQAMTSPRRTALLDSLTQEELFLLRENPSFFFTGNAIAAAMPTGDQAGQQSTASSDSGKAPKSLWPGRVDSSVFEDVIEFFSVSSADKNLEIPVYVRHLRAQLLASAGRHNNLLGAGSSIDWRQRLCRNEVEEGPSEEQPAVDESVPKGPLEMMPCLGRHPPLRDDQASPTLLRVREVYERRDEQDAQWVNERREGIARRLALNSFKAREQQRELLLQDFKQKELHKVRMLQAEEKKAMLEYETQERTELMSIQKIHRLMVANERAERIKEEKRGAVTASLVSWQEGMAQAQQNIRKSEWEKRKDGERSQAKYMARLSALGESRMNVFRSQSQKNDELKGNIQASLCAQLKEREIQGSLEKAEIFKAKQDAAALRRHYHSLGNRYCLVEKAFGANSVGFDAKHHSVSVDRRGKSWQKVAAGWAKTKGSFSAPALPPARPLSPGGTLDEAEFKAAFADSGGFKTETSAVALV